MATFSVTELEKLRKAFDARWMPEPNSGCWLWTGSYQSSGYGIYEMPFAQQRIRAHRLSWLLHCGQLPRDLYICHQCDVRGCVNPKHLWIGTTQQNTADKVLKNRQARRTRENCWNNKLDWEKVRLIRQDGRPRRIIAEQYGVSGSLITLVKKHVIWRENFIS